MFLMHRKPFYAQAYLRDTGGVTDPLVTEQQLEAGGGGTGQGRAEAGVGWGEECVCICLPWGVIRMCRAGKRETVKLELP